MGFSIGKALGSVISAPFKAVAAVAKAVTPVATELLRTVLNTGFEAVKFGANMMQSMGPLGYLMNPMMALAAPLIGQGAQGLQNLTNQGLTAFNSAVQGREVPYPPQYAGQPYPGQMYLPPFDQRMASPYGFPGQYGGQQIAAQLGTYAATAAGIGGGSGAAVAAGAGFMPTGINPAGNSNADLVNTIANAPLFSPDEAQLMSKLRPEQQAMMTLQAKKQRESLMTSILTNIANMKHESLKGIAQNLRG